MKYGDEDFAIHERSSTDDLNRMIRHALQRHDILMALENERNELSGYMNIVRSGEMDAIFSDDSALVVQDAELVRENSRLLERLEYLALHDPLTKLPNRLYCQKMLRNSLAQAARYNYQFSFMLLDIKDFNDINERFDHEVGDEILKQIAERLTKILRKNDMAARIGGDEFAVLLPVIDRS